MSSATALYIKNGPPRDYPIYMASHFDETSKIPTAYYNTNGKHLTLLMGWYGDADTVGKQSDKAYVLYQGRMNEMDVVFGDTSSGIYEAHFGYPSQCEPYAFVVVTVDNVMYRLPEENKYFYGTSWVELESGVPRKPDVDYVNCNENHYYKDDRENGQWIANGGDNITKAEIAYIDHDQCEGCTAIDALVSVFDQFVNNGYQVAVPTQYPTNHPSNHPISTPHPTNHPTLDPTTLPTNHPSLDPTILPTNHPTSIPTVAPISTPQPTNQQSISPTYIPSKSPALYPTLIPTLDPSRSPTLYPTLIPTLDPSRSPTLYPTLIPTLDPSKSPTYIPTTSPTSNDSNPIPPIQTPSHLPSSSPTNVPSTTPTDIPSIPPTKVPSISPTGVPSHNPSIWPSYSPTQTPSTFIPSVSPIGYEFDTTENGFRTTPQTSATEVTSNHTLVNTMTTSQAEIRRHNQHGTVHEDYTMEISLICAAVALCVILSVITLYYTHAKCHKKNEKKASSISTHHTMTDTVQYLTEDDDMDIDDVAAAYNTSLHHLTYGIATKNAVVPMNTVDSLDL
eukprot:156041_1